MPIQYDSARHWRDPCVTGFRKPCYLLGRPFSKVTFPLTGQTAWAWRFVESVWFRCFFAYVGPDGKVTGTGSKDEETGDQGLLVAMPC